MNHLTKYDVESFEVQPAFRKTKPYLFTPADHPFTRVCSFQPKCRYMKDKPLTGPLNKDTFMIDYSQGSVDTYKKRIALLLRENGSIELSHLKTMIEEYQEVHDVFLSNAVDQCVSERYPVMSSQGIMGYPIINDGHLLFQPSFSTDVLIPYYYRYTRGDIRSKYPILKPLDIRETIIRTDDKKYSKGERKAVIAELTSYPLTEIEKTVFEIFKFSDSVRCDYIIDRLSYDQRLVMMSIACSLVTNKTNKSDYNVDDENLDHIIAYSSKLFISYSEDTDTFSYRGTQSSLYGFVLYHPRNKKLYSYRYVKDTDSISLTNAIDQIQIESQLQGKQSLTFKNDRLGFYDLFG